jgi:hypothetical protein
MIGAGFEDGSREALMQVNPARGAGLNANAATTEG